MLTAESAAEVVGEAYRAGGAGAAVEKLRWLHANKQDRYYFSAYELLALCEPMLATGRVGDAEALRQALIEVLLAALRIQEGFAQICMMSGQVQKGMEILRELDAEDPSFAWYSLAVLYRDLGEIENAIEACRKCLELQPNHGDAHSLLERLERQR